MTATVTRLDVARYPAGEKRCSRCGEVKPLDEFRQQVRSRRNSVTVTRQSQCRACACLTRNESRDRIANGIRLRPRWRNGEKQPETVRDAIAGSVVTLPVPARAPMPKPTGRVVLRDVPTCVCGATRPMHRNGSGACDATGCPEWFERGC